VNISYKEITAV